jgi:mono/diheme cytochrome c family protein
VGPTRIGLAAGVLGVACLAGGCKHEAGPVMPVEGAALYDQMCLRCHGPDGRGDPEIAKVMPVRDLTSPPVQGMGNEELERLIMAGKNQMPAFGGMMSVRKIQAVLGHVRHLGRKPGQPGPK